MLSYRSHTNPLNSIGKLSKQFDPGSRMNYHQGSYWLPVAFGTEGRELASPMALVSEGTMDTFYLPCLGLMVLFHITHVLVMPPVDHGFEMVNRTTKIGEVAKNVSKGLLRGFAHCFPHVSFFMKGVAFKRLMINGNFTQVIW